MTPDKVTSMNNIYRAENGKFYLRYMIQGKDVRKSLRTTDEALARKIADAMMQRVEQTRVCATGRDKRMPFEQAVVDFFDANDRRLARTTVLRYKQCAKKLLPHLMGVPLWAINRKMVHDLVEKLRKQPTRHGKLPTDATIIRDLFFLSALMKWARRENIVDENFDPIAAYDRSHLKDSPVRVKWLDPESMKLLLQSLPPYHAGLVRFAAETGLRWNEISKLRWEWFSTVEDPQTRKKHPVLNLPGDYQLGDKVYRVAKGGKARTVPLTEGAIEALRASPTAGKRGGWVWPNPKSLKRVVLTPIGKPPRKFLEATRALQLNGFHFHDLRHHAASQWRQGGMDLGLVKELLGHSNYQTTLRYAHVGPEHLVRAIKRHDEGRAVKGETGIADDFFSAFAEQTRAPDSEIPPKTGSE